MKKKIAIILSCGFAVAIGLSVALPLNLNKPKDPNEEHISKIAKIEMKSVDDDLFSKAFIDYRIVSNVKYIRYSVAVDAARINSLSITRKTDGRSDSTEEIYFVYKGIDFRGTSMYYDLDTDRLTSVEPTQTRYYFACYSVKLETPLSLTLDFTFSGSVTGVDNEVYELPEVTASYDDYWDHYLPVDSTDTEYGIREFWENGSGKLAFEKPDSENITEVGEPKRAFINSLDENDLRLICRRGGVFNVPTTSGDNWEVVANAPARVEFGSTVGTRPNDCAEFKDYQYNDWKENQLGIKATYSPLSPVRANRILFTYYLYRATDVKADLTVSLSCIDKFGNRIEIDSFVILKTDSASWLSYSKNFKLSTYTKLVIETKSEHIKNETTNQLFICDIQLTCLNTHTSTISTKNPTNWVGVSRNPEKDQNRIDVGSKNYWDPDKGLGDYLALRAYQWNDWGPNDSGVTAIYTSPTPKLTNKLSFNYYINPGSFVAPEATFKIYIVSGEVKTLIDTIVIDSNSPRSEVINYPVSFDRIILNELHFELFTNDPDKTIGNSVVFVKDLSINSYEGPDVPRATGDMSLDTTNANLWSSYSSNDDNKILTGTGAYYGSGSTGVYLTIRTFQEANPTSNTKSVTAIYENSLMKTINHLSFTYYLNVGDFVNGSFMDVKITVIGNGKRTVVKTINGIEKPDTEIGIGIDISESFDEIVFDGLEIEVTTTFGAATGNTCFFVKELKCSFVD